MTSPPLLRLFIGGSLAFFIGVYLPKYLPATQWMHRAVTDKYGVLLVCLGILFFSLIKWRTTNSQKREKQESGEIYGLQHGRLHLQVPTPMWMNMGYWDESGTTKSLAEACRDLLKAVLAEAGLSSEIEGAETANGTRRKKMLIDLGIGCGDQTIYLTSKEPVRPCDKVWWDVREHCVRFDHYIGITNDFVQARYALERVEEQRTSGKMDDHGEKEKAGSSVSIFCADAARPSKWNEEIQASIKSACTDCPERWVLALDTAYHFSPSRWLMVEHAHANLHASFMAFDLCLSPTATFVQKFVLRILTLLMGAPFTNFVTPEDYRSRLVAIGYPNDTVEVVDISERVFAPLAQFLDDQDRRLKTLGLGIGRFGVAKSLFKWWGRTGVVRGVIIVAKR
jgi:hypothetical protein